jgi:DNA primase
MTNNNLPIKPVIEHYGGRLNRNIENWQKVKCPFHDDSHASAGVSVREGLFVCHGCGVKGNAINIVAIQEGVKFREAIKIAEGITGEGYQSLQQKHSSGRRVSSTQRIRSRSGSGDSIRSRR